MRRTLLISLFKIVKRWRVFISLILFCLFSLLTVHAQSDVNEWQVPKDVTQSSFVETGVFGTLICDSQQNVHLLWSHLAPEGALLFYQNDVGGYLSNPVDVIAFSDETMIRLFAAISEVDNSLHVIWQDAYISGDVYYARASLDKAGDPRAWSLPSLLIEGATAQLFIDEHGILHIIFSKSDNDGLTNELYYMRSEDNGDSWLTPQLVVFIPTTLPSTISGGIAVDDVGRIHVGVTVRSQEYGASSEVGYIQSDDGQTWSAYRQIMVDGTDFQGVSTMRPYIFGEGEVHLTWHDPRRMHQFSLDRGETWSEPAEIMSLGAAFGGPNQLVEDSAGSLHAILATGGGVYSTQWVGNQWGNYQQIDERPIDPHGQDMIVCQGNQLHAVYYDRIGGQKVWYSTRTVAAPHIERGLQIVSEGYSPTPAITLVPALDINADTLPISQTSEILAAPNTVPQQNSSFYSFLAAIGVTLGFLVVAVVSLTWRNRVNR